MECMVVCVRVSLPPFALASLAHIDGLQRASMRSGFAPKPRAGDPDSGRRLWRELRLPRVGRGRRSSREDEFAPTTLFLLRLDAQPLSRSLLSLTPLAFTLHSRLSRPPFALTSHKLISLRPLTFSFHSTLSSSPLTHTSHILISLTPVSFSFYSSR
eukprot:6199904-Pleurochrysis_carterae.AAC.8